tara:strand:+ start:72 stop:455 length:384 start_codon:yes stop_codon:yes gene_type:complete
MPLLLTQSTESKHIVELNPTVHAVYIEGATEGVATPWVRWARSNQRCHPLTILEKHTDKMIPLSYTTLSRDKSKLQEQLTTIENISRQGCAIVFPMHNYFLAMELVKDTSPDIYALVNNRITQWDKF